MIWRGSIERRALDHAAELRLTWTTAAPLPSSGREQVPVAVVPCLPEETVVVLTKDEAVHLFEQIRYAAEICPVCNAMIAKLRAAQGDTP